MQLNCANLPQKTLKYTDHVSLNHPKKARFPFLNLLVLKAGEGLDLRDTPYLYKHIYMYI